jgi:hypothetical protein
VENLVGLRVTEVNITVNDVQFPEERPMLGQQEQVKQQAQRACGKAGAGARHKVVAAE